MRHYLPLLTALAACSGEAPAATAGAEPSSAQTEVRPGIEVLLTDSIHLIRGRRLGLITNQTGVDRQRSSSIDLLMETEGTDLVALFAPEHGIRGQAEAGELLDDTRDTRTGLPIHSLYGGATRKPTPESLEALDVLLFDLQDIGARYYTFIYTMALAMEAAGEADIPFVVLDRPNPIGGEAVQGNVLDPALASFVGLYPIPMRHGMTTGELARLFQGEFGIDVQLHVVPAEGWRRSTSFQDTGLPWIAPSPNMPSVASATHYPGTCLFEGTNLSVGRGTPIAFQHVGAPWLDGEELARRLNAYEIEGVSFHPTRFTPESPGDGKFGGELVHGVRLEVTGPGYDPTVAALATLVESRAMSGDQWQWNEQHFDRLAGSTSLRERIDRGSEMPALRMGWDNALQSFEAVRELYLIYR